MSEKCVRQWLTTKIRLWKYRFFRGIRVSWAVGISFANACNERGKKGEFRYGMVVFRSDDGIHHILGRDNGRMGELLGDV